MAHIWTAQRSTFKPHLRLCRFSTLWAGASGSSMRLLMPRQFGSGSSMRLPNHKAVWERRLKQRIQRMTLSYSMRVWRENSLRKSRKISVAIFLTGHVALNYHLNKCKPEKMLKKCLSCL